MKNQTYILLVVILVVGASWFLLHKKQIATHQQQALATNGPATATQMPANNSTAQEIANNGSNGSNAVAEIAEKYDQGLMGKDQAVQAVILDQNNKSLDIYGKVVDQNGEPVAGAKVQGSLGLNISMVKSGGKFLYTETDPNGCFSFLDVHGAGMGILLQKEGYFYNQRIPTPRPGSYKLDPNNPVVFTMWKIHGGDQLVKSAINADLSPVGSPATFDIGTGKETAAGDFRMTFSRSPSAIAPGLVHPYDWQFKIEVVSGGLLQEDDPYPYLAPDTGYQPSFEINVSSNNVPWQNQFEQNFYIKNSQGHYALMKVLVYSASTPPEAQISFTVNPSGSRNLEPDFSK